MYDRFFDVTPANWFYKDVTELDAILDANDKNFISGIPFNEFVDGYDAVDQIITVQAPTNTITVGKVLTHTLATPVKVYVDGVATVFDTVTPNKPSTGMSEIKLRRSVSTSSIVRVVQQGVPETDPTKGNRPIGVTKAFRYPQLQLPIPEGHVYVHNPFSTLGFEKVSYKGSQLKRVDYPGDEVIQSSYSVFKFEDEYTVSPTGLLHVSFHLDNVNLQIDYLVTNSVTGVELQKWFGGSQVIAQRPMIPSSNPPTQFDKVYFGFFPDISITRAEFFTFLNHMRKILWSKFSNTAPYENKSKPISQSRFPDVANQPANTWWWPSVRDLEDLKMPDGSYFLNGYPDGKLYHSNAMTRAQAVSLMNSFRIWFIEAFK